MLTDNMTHNSQVGAEESARSAAEAIGTRAFRWTAGWTGSAASVVSPL